MYKVTHASNKIKNVAKSAPHRFYWVMKGFVIIVQAIASFCCCSVQQLQSQHKQTKATKGKVLEEEKICRIYFILFDLFLNHDVFFSFVVFLEKWRCCSR